MKLRFMLFATSFLRAGTRSVRGEAACFAHEHPQEDLELVQEGLDGQLARREAG